ncbi:TPA: phage tail tape measure protein [Klebsiella pneumoniae]|nr:phage tail tape measure protein [Klebsiella pneumoniae]
MPSSFSIGVVVSAALHGTFRSVMGNAQRTLDRLSSATTQMQQRQEALTRAASRYGSLGGDAARRLNSELTRVGQTMEQLQRRQASLSRATIASTALRDNRMKLYAQGLETYGMARAVYGAVAPSVKKAATFQDNMTDMAITAGYDNKTRDSLGKNIRAWSLKYNQTQDDLQAATSSLIGNNIDDIDDIRAYLPSIARGATATRTTAEQWAEAAFTTKQSLGIAAKDFAAVQNIMAYGGKAGSFEIPDQVKWLPSLAPQMAGISQGKEAVAEMAAALQVAKIGAGTSDEAANNFKNFLTKLFAPDTQKRFADQGINLSESLMRQKAEGISPIEGMMNVIQWSLEQKGPEAVKQFKAAMALKDDAARDQALQALQKNFGLGELFADMQVMAFVRPMLANMDKYRTIRAEALKSANNDVLGADYAKRLESPIEKMKKLMVATSDLGITLGEQLMPQVMGVADAILPYITRLNTWAQTHPQVIQGIAGVIVGLLAFKGGLFILRMALNLAATPVFSLIKSFQGLRSGWLLLRAGFGQGGGISRAAGAIGRLTRGIAGLTRSLAGGMLRGIVRGGALMGRMGSAGLRLGRILGGVLRQGLMIAGRAVLFIGRALMMNPIGLLITGIAVGAFLIYRYWGPISTWFKARWEDIKRAFSGGITGVAALIINWSPVGLFYKAFAAVMRYFNIELPANFTDFGANMIDGLVSGITSKLAAAKDTIVNFGSSVKGWFTETLGINSPSRVFMGFGDNIVQGAVIGIDRTTPQAGSAASRLASALMPFGNSTPLAGWFADLPARITRLAGQASQGLSTLLVPSVSRRPPVPEVPTWPEAGESTAVRGGLARRGRGAAGPSGPGITVHFAPVIHIDGKRQNAGPEIQNALGMGVRELEQMLARVLQQQQRRSFE